MSGTTFNAFSAPLDSALNTFLRLVHTHKKGVGAVLLPILRAQAFALPHLHRIDNAVSPRQNELYIIYGI